MSRSLDDWLDHQQRLHPREIELGLDRLRAVWQRLGSPAPSDVVISVGGTNGKGSTVAFLEAMARAAGLRVGAFTSPHLLAYNERVRIDGADAGDDALVAAFERIEAERGDMALTYFEFGFLAAVLLFADARLDLAILEVGLGGRLDAVNLIDADAAVITTIDLDHQDWLGSDRDAIGREKAGIARADRPVIIGERAPPAGLIQAAEAAGARLVRAGHEFSVELHGDHWTWRTSQHELDLPPPGLAAVAQIDNAAAAIAAVHALRGRLGWNPMAIAAGVANARASARMQRWHSAGGIELLVDVAHNPQAAREMARWLAANPPAGRNLAVFGALADKDVAGVVAALQDAIAVWQIGGLDGELARGLAVAGLHERMDVDATRQVLHSPDIVTALEAARAMARPGDRIVAFGSFHVAGPALRWARAAGFVATTQAAAATLRL